MTLQLNPGSLKVGQYPMPIKANFTSIKLNGESANAAMTTGRGKEYTYFQIKGADLWVPGHLDTSVEYTIEFPADFAPKTLKATRIVAKKPKVAKVAKVAEVAETQPESPAPVASGDGDAPAPFFGKKKQRN
jgi:hypothetical protein